MLSKAWDYSNYESLARAVNARFNPMIFLHSSMHTNYSGRYSILAFDIKHEVRDNFSNLESVLSSHNSPFKNAYFGFISYEAMHQLEELNKETQSIINTPDLLFYSFNIIIRFDHINKDAVLFYNHPEDLSKIPNPEPAPLLQLQCIVKDLQSKQTKTQYLNAVSSLLSCIHRGDIYQANLTRKFYGTFQNLSSQFELFLHLCNVSPAPYSAFMNCENFSILSSSPEKFLSIESNGSITTQPIKGTTKRHNDPEKDQHSYHSLKHSKKDKAENLMIVDLMRNDLSKTAINGSVSVPSLYDIHSYETVHHMSSIIHSKKNPAYSTLDALKTCFPPGSMTGAPKIKAIELCAELEQIKRGVYSGALGYFGGDGSADFSVVIRTLIIQGNCFEFQVGGAIIAESVAENEWQETLDKAAGICRALGIGSLD